jgi:hypothetical protein
MKTIKQKNIDIDKYKHFRKVSIIFYIFSFTIITISFIFYLYANKNNRSCQYGSTLYCNTENYYYVTGTEGDFNQITFQNYSPSSDSTLTSPTTIRYPYSNTPDYYDINYFFGISGGPVVTNINDTVGISARSEGASIYFDQEAPYLSSDLANWTRFLISQNNISSFTILEPVKNSVVGLFEYSYASGDKNDNEAITPANIANFYNTEQPQWENVQPVKTNWMNLFKNNKNQHTAGCSAGSTIGCACIDPGYISSIKCNDYVLNTESGLYCPPENLNCTVPCTDSSDSSGCGYRFCSVANNIDPNQINSNSTTNPDGLTKLGKNGYYQNSVISGMKTPNDASIYTVGVKGGLLTSALGVPTNNFSLRSTTDGFAGYPTLQNRSFCGGTSTNKNNFGDNIGDTQKFSDSASDTYNPQFATYPKFNADTKFDF